MRTLITPVLALGLIVIAASVARADTFACVNNSSGEVKIVKSCTVGTNDTPCHHNDTCIDIGPGPLALQIVCETENTGANGSFNIDALCPAGDVVVTGGYACATDSAFGTPAPATLSVNTFHFSNVTPDGWQSIGALDSGTSGTCRVCASCTTGTVQ